MHRGPNKKTLAGRVRQFFKENPSEFLTYEDMQTKFGCTYQQATRTVYDLGYRGGVIESVTVIRAKEKQ